MEFSDDITLRGYSPGYLDAMFRLDVTCFAERFRFSRTNLRRFAEARNARVILALRGEELVGFTIVHFELEGGMSIGYLLTLDVAPAFRRRGLARLFLANAESGAVDAGCETMLLHVFTGNDAAIALYESRGYNRTGFAHDFYNAGMSAWVYKKSLPPKTR